MSHLFPELYSRRGRDNINVDIIFFLLNLEIIVRNFQISK
jgi:hypothetical protein